MSRYSLAGTPAADDPDVDKAAEIPDPTLGDGDQLLPDELPEDTDTDGGADPNVTPDPNDDEGSGK